MKYSIFTYTFLSRFFLLIFFAFLFVTATCEKVNILDTTICANSDFSDGNFNGWTACYGHFSTPCTSLGFDTTGAHPLFKIIPAPGWYDANTCYGLLNVYPGNSYVARLGDTMYTSAINKEAELKYNVTVTSTSYLFIYRYAPVLQTGGHPVGEQPDFRVEVTDSTGALLDSCGYFYFPAPVSGPPPSGWHLCTNVNNGNVYWKDWTTVGMDLTPFFGQTVTINFRARGCWYNTHFGYAYVTAFCGYLVVRTAMCEGDSSATLTAPPGFTYLWSNNDTTESIVVPHPVTGSSYSCTLTALNGCQVTITDTLSYTIINTNFTHGSACTNSPTQFNDSSYVNQNAVVNWSWNFGDGTPVVNGVANPTHSFTNAGTYNVKLISFSTEGCKDSITKQVAVDTLPVINNPVNREQICSNHGTNIILTTNVTNPLFTWTATSSSMTLTGFSNMSTPTPGPINQVLVNSANHPDSVTYIITPYKGMCQGLPFTYVVVVFPKPNVNYTPAAPAICADQTTNIQLTSSLPNTSYSWTAASDSLDVTGYGPGSGNVIAQTLHQPGFSIEYVTYHVVPMANSCPGDTVNIVVLINPKPHLLTNPMDQTICSKASTNIVLVSSCPGTSYTWTSAVVTGNITGNGAGSGSPIIQLLTNNLSTQGQVNYTIHPTTGSCIGNDTVFIVIVDALPVPVITGTNILCAGSTGVVYTAQAGMTGYSWSVSAGGTVTAGGTSIDNTVTITWNNVGSQTVSVNYTDGNGCTAIAPTVYTVTVNPLPTATISGTTAVCQNAASPQITFTGASSTPPYTFTYNINGGADQNVTTVVGNSVTLAAPTNIVGSFTYNLISVQDGSSTACSQFQSGSAVITVNPLPTATIDGTTAVCQNAVPPLITFTGSSSISPYTFIYNINGGGNQNVTTSGGNSVTVAAPTSIAGSFTYNLISVQDGSSTACSQFQSGSATVTVNPLPTATISGTIAVCQNSPSPLITFTGGSSTAPYTFTYNINGGANQNVSTIVGNSVTVSAPTNVVGIFNYNLISVQDASSTLCSQLQSGTSTVTVNSLPVPSISGATAVCLNSSSTYLTDAGMSNYSWTVSAGGTITSGTGTNSITVLWSTTGSKTIQVNYINANGCTAASPSSYTVTVNTLPVPSLTGTNTLCSGLSAVYTTDPGMSTYSWSVSAGGSIIAGGGTTDNTVTVLWNTAGAQTVSVNYLMGPSCTAPSPTVLNVTVKPRPSITNAANSTMCSNGTTNIVPIANLPGTTFSWTATGSSGNVSGYSNGSGSSIIQTLVNTGFNIETVTYAVTPSLNGCDGAIADYIVTVNPIADVYFNPNGQTFCSGGTTSISILSHVAGATFTWTATGSSGNVSGFGPGGGSIISQTLNNSGTDIENVNYDVSPLANSCAGTDNHVIVTVNPVPQVSFTNCNDIITTTDAKPITLKGGIPLGGVYSGTGVNAGIFYPSLAGPGNFIINYSYTNTWGCNENKSQTISVISATLFSCDNTLTDIRDNQTYPTVKIGTQCWMSANLNYGTIIPSTSMQRDNCIAEKYCYSDNVTNCATYGGLYQWDELMQYDNTPADQGFCPPAWHIPTNNDWNTLFAFYISNGFAGSPLKYTGYSGFNAFLSGTRFNNVSWNFINFAVMFWTSSSEGTQKAWAHGMNTFNPSVSNYPGSRNHAFNVRCIKD